MVVPPVAHKFEKQIIPCAYDDRRRQVMARPFTPALSVCSTLLVAFFVSMVAQRSATASDEVSTSDSKTLTMIIGYTAGGGVDAAGRLIAQFLPRYLPGHSPFIVQRCQIATVVPLSSVVCLTDRSEVDLLPL
jgi:hypothetical protein